MLFGKWGPCPLFMSQGTHSTHMHSVKASTWLTNNPNKALILCAEIPLGCKHRGLKLVVAELWSLWKAG